MSVSGAYQLLPRKAYRLRLLFLMLPLLWVSLIGVGIAGFSSFNPLPPPSRVGSKWNPFAASTSFYSIYLAEWSRAPEGCVSGEVHSDFQRGRCTLFWDRMTQGSLIAASPLIALWVAYVLGMDSLRMTYRRVRRKIENGKAIAKGVVTNPALATNDFYGWFYGFRCISVEIGKRAQVRVYFPLEGQLPLPGDPIAVFGTGRSLGQARFFGIYYAPHVAVIGGMSDG